MAKASNTESNFQLGLDAGPIGRVSRLILGGMIPIYSIIRLLIDNDPTLGFYTQAVIYFAAIFVAYLAAHYFLGEIVRFPVTPAGVADLEPSSAVMSWSLNSDL